MSIAAIYQAALFMPTSKDACICVQILRMTAAAASQIERQTVKKLRDRLVNTTMADRDDMELKLRDPEYDPFVVSHRQNAATTIVWALLHLLAPEVAFRKDAVHALYALTYALAASSMCDAHVVGAQEYAVAGGLASTSLEMQLLECPTVEDAVTLLSANIFGLHLFWPPPAAATTTSC